MNKQISIPAPEMAPFGGEITAATVGTVWDTFVKPEQLSDAPQSVEMRALMGVLRAVFAGLEAAEKMGDGPLQAHAMMQRRDGAGLAFYCVCGWDPRAFNLGRAAGRYPKDAEESQLWLEIHIATAREVQA